MVFTYALNLFISDYFWVCFFWPLCFMVQKIFSKHEFYDVILQVSGLVLCRITFWLRYGYGIHSSHLISHFVSNSFCYCLFLLVLVIWICIRRSIVSHKELDNENNYLYLTKWKLRITKQLNSALLFSFLWRPVPTWFTL